MDIGTDGGRSCVCAASPACVPLKKMTHDMCSSLVLDSSTRLFFQISEAKVRGLFTPKDCGAEDTSSG